MKLLKGQVETVEGDGITIEVEAVSMIAQGEISDFEARMTLTGKIKAFSYMLRTVVKSISLNGEVLDKNVIANQMDLTNDDNFKFFEAAYDLIKQVTHPSEYELKKSRRQQPPGASEKTVQSARSKDKPRKPAK